MGETKGPRAISCAECGGRIEPGEAVALYGSAPEKLRTGAKTVTGGNGKGRAAIGCLRFGCAEGGVTMPGVWDGFVLVIRKGDTFTREWLDKAFGITGDTVAPDPERETRA